MRPRPTPVFTFSLRLVTAYSLTVLALWSPPARASPWSEAFDADEAELEERFADGDIDAEDHEVLRIGARAGASDVHGESWVSITGFERSLLSGKHDIGGMLVVALALDRISEGSVHRLQIPLADPAGNGDLAGDAASDGGTPPAVERPLVLPALARRCVAAALRASGLGTDDARLDAIVSRARSSALFPEARLRAMRLWDDAAHATTLATTNDTTYYDAIGANLVLELRLTWRLDRLIYAGDEPNIERLRLERQDARARLATRTLEVLFAWERAAVDDAGAAPGSRDEIAARLRAAEAAATLDVLTAGWFSSREAPSP
jgi:hypothetical protein